MKLLCYLINIQKSMLEGHIIYNRDALQTNERIEWVKVVSYESNSISASETVYYRTLHRHWFSTYYY